MDTQIIGVDTPSISSMGDSGLVFDAGHVPEISVQQRIWALEAAIRSVEGVCETLVGMSNLLVVYDPLIVDAETMKSVLFDCWTASTDVVIEGRTLEIEVEYGGDEGPDLGLVAEHAGLTEAEVIRLHSSARYRVFAVGSSPGFGYLSGLPHQIATPRRSTPILRTEPGSVMIGGAQTGVTNTSGPTGWYVIGRTRRRLFNPFAENPCELAAGDHIVFLDSRSKDANT